MAQYFQNVFGKGKGTGPQGPGPQGYGPPPGYQGADGMGGPPIGPQDMFFGALLGTIIAWFTKYKHNVLEEKVFK